MSIERGEAERLIQQALASQWHPIAKPDVSSYVAHAHDVYSLLARGASDAQVGRHLHEIEREEMGHADADARDLTEVLKTLRTIERTI